MAILWPVDSDGTLEGRQHSKLPLGVVYRVCLSLLRSSVFVLERLVNCLTCGARSRCKLSCSFGFCYFPSLSKYQVWMHACMHACVRMCVCMYVCFGNKMICASKAVHCSCDTSRRCRPSRPVRRMAVDRHAGGFRVSGFRGFRVFGV